MPFTLAAPLNQFPTERAAPNRQTRACALRCDILLPFLLVLLLLQPLALAAMTSLATPIPYYHHVNIRNTTRHSIPEPVHNSLQKRRRQERTQENNRNNSGNGAPPDNTASLIPPTFSPLSSPHHHYHHHHHHHPLQEQQAHEKNQATTKKFSPTDTQTPTQKLDPTSIVVISTFVCFSIIAIVIATHLICVFNRILNMSPSEFAAFLAYLSKHKTSNLAATTKAEVDTKSVERCGEEATCKSKKYYFDFVPRRDCADGDIDIPWGHPPESLDSFSSCSSLPVQQQKQKMSQSEPTSNVQDNIQTNKARSEPTLR